MSQNKLLVIIVIYNAMKWANKCFSSLRESSVKNDVFIVDNGSEDGSQEYIQNNYPEFIFHQSKNNLGFGKANNIGLQYALDYAYDYVYLLNQDAWVMHDTFEKLIEVSKKYPDYGIISPMQMQSNLQHWDINFGENFITNNKKGISISEDFYFHRNVLIYEVPFIMAAHWLVSVNTIKKVGLFSPIFPHYAEDDNYCNRTKYWNFKIGICPNALAVHDREFREEPFGIKKAYLEYLRFVSIINNPNSDQKLLKILFRFIQFALKIIFTNKIPLKNKLNLVGKMIKSISLSRKFVVLYKRKSAFIKY